jgi:hypothetical protein
MAGDQTGSSSISGSVTDGNKIPTANYTLQNNESSRRYTMYVWYQERLGKKGGVVHVAREQKNKRINTAVRCTEYVSGSHSKKLLHTRAFSAPTCCLYLSSNIRNARIVLAT